MGLEEKIKRKEAKVAIIGAGYVGLPLAIAFAEEKFMVFAIDKDEEKVMKLKAGESYIEDVTSEQVKSALDSGFLNPTTSDDVLAQADAAIITVPTPVKRHKDPDLSYIEKAADSVAKHIHSPMLISLESTTYPGSTEDILLPRLSKANLKVGKDFFLVFSPERINPGDKEHTLRKIPKIVGGVTPKCTEMGYLLYSQIINKVIPVSNAKTAEMIKLYENAYRYINIAFANEMAIVCRKLGIDIWEVIEGAKSKGFGFQAFYPGPGVGGHCIPVDPHYLRWHLKGIDHNELLLEVADSINMGMPSKILEILIDVLNEEGKHLNGSNILILGVTYKKDIADLRESPAVKLMDLLVEKKANLAYSDPYITKIPERDYIRKDLNEETLAWADVVVLTTDHSSFDYQWIADNCACILDTRNAFRGVKNCRAKIYRL
ncbi:nucleotide sugar dehydrogenase [bacterium]|nr:nucleotide sugar dehydrogenase [bacterium]